VGGTLEAGKVWNEAATRSTNKTQWGMSLYVGADTVIGPVYFGLMHAPKQDTSIYLLVGRP
jgi:NTE family protein